jgi:hypothetical protein
VYVDLLQADLFQRKKGATTEAHNDGKRAHGEDDDAAESTEVEAEENDTLLGEHGGRRSLWELATMQDKSTSVGDDMKAEKSAKPAKSTKPAKSIKPAKPAEATTSAKAAARKNGIKCGSSSQDGSSSEHMSSGGGSSGESGMHAHVFEFFSGFDPDWEFRGFVANGKRTGLTVYSPWVYQQRMVEEYDRLLEIITRLWDRVEPCIRSDNYSVDFAVSPALNGDCWIVEINNFLPPLAGSGLFNYNDSADRQLLLHPQGVRPFEFRIRREPMTSADLEYRNEETGRSIVMQPAPPHTMAFVRAQRFEIQGLLQPPAPPDAFADKACGANGAGRAPPRRRRKCAVQ